MDTKIVTIDLGTRSYDIYIGSGLLFRAADFVPQDIEGRTVFIVCDSNVREYAQQIHNLLSEAGVSQAAMLVLKPGEQTKTFAQVEKICRWALDNGVNRNSIMFAVGGGVVGDITGFCASIIMRGIPFVQIPTTLLAQVDSSVGGKTGINTPQGKNLVGSFYQPESVIADIDTLKTLPHRELLAGYAELAKYGLIGDAAFFEWLEQEGKDLIALQEHAVKHGIEVATKAKATIVQADERESGQRALLNLGHTFGHALEAVAGYDGRLLHGEAVAIGICMAFDLSSRMDLCSRQDYERVEQHFIDVGLPTRASYIQPPLRTTVDQMINIMRRDKKVQSGKMRFVLVNGIGLAFLTDDVPEGLVRDVIKESLGTEIHGIKERWKSVFSSQS